MPSKRSRGVKITLITLATLIVVVLVLTVAGALFVIRRPLAQESGTVQIDALDASVSVQRDERGIPQIYADSALDLFRAQGYVTAQDRFFEMDYRRHVTAGRLSELVGVNADALAADKMIRTLGWRTVAEQEWKILDQHTRDYLQAYADGVNAYLNGRSTSSIAMEYTVLGLQVKVTNPEPWSPIDSLAWLKAMAWDLRGNYDQELERALTYGTLQDVARVNELFPTYPYDANGTILSATSAQQASNEVSLAPQTATVLRSADGLAAIQGALEALDAVPQLLGTGEGTGSNSWVVSGQYTTSGKPLLANDPHLGISAPGIWYQVGLHCNTVKDSCPFDVAGYSFSGFPGIVIGHNASLAWGLTNLGADVSDFFIEKVTGRTYQVDDTVKPLEYRVETIKVNGAPDVSITVRSTEHGPIISDVVDSAANILAAPLPGAIDPRRGEYAVALQWTALNPGHTADALFELNTAASAEDIAAAAAHFEVPAQNIVFATTDGHIGYQVPGSIPVRGQVSAVVPSDGSWPRPGWDSAYDWQGYVEASQLPHALDPPEGYIVAANQAVTQPGASVFLTNDWDYGYRAAAITTMLRDKIDAGTKVDAAAMSQMQMSQVNPYAQILVPYLLQVPITDDFLDQAVDLLRGWDCVQSQDSAAGAYFAAVWSNVLRLTFHDELPEQVWPDGGSRWLAVMTNLLRDPTNWWWDDHTTVGEVENRDSILLQAMQDARLELTTRIAKDPAEWTWGKLHLAAPQHAVLGGDGVPSFVRTLVNPRPLQVGGGSSIVDATGWSVASAQGERTDYSVNWIPSMRMVVDLSDLDASTWVNFTGNSGQPGSSHYTDQFAAWADGSTFPWAFTRTAVQGATVATLTLRP